MHITQIRLANLRELFAQHDIEGLLVTDPINMRWLSGFRGSYGRLLVTIDKAILATDSRYWTQARSEAPGFELFQDARQVEDTIAFLSEGGIKHIGFEANHITWAEGKKLQAIPGYQWQPVSDIFEPLRAIKNEDELRHIKAAAAITDKVMSQVPQLLQLGISEAELAWQLEKMMRDQGATGLAFPIIVAFGSNSALPHHHPGPQTLGEREIVLVDMGADVKGYKSDLTRTFFFGEQDETFTALYQLVLGGQSAALEGVRAGAKSRQIHQLALDFIDQSGYGDKFPHGLGHGLGLEIHEYPFLSILREDISLQAGMVLTIEPGIYLEGWGGIRTEDLIMITADGCQLLSQCPK